MMEKQIVEMVARKVEERLTDVICRTVETTKNNGVVKNGIAIKKNGSSIEVVFYINGIFEEPDIMADEIVKEYEKKDTATDEAIYRFSEKIKQNKDFEQVVFRVVNAEKNAERLKNVPHVDFLNLAAEYIVPVDEGADGSISSIRITNGMLEALGISESKLYKRAFDCSREYYGFKVMDMMEMLAALGIPSVGGEEAAPMYVCTSQNKTNGATIMMYPDLFTEIADKEKCDLFIIPSSIHEVLAIPASTVSDPQDLKKMCNEVNSSEVSPEEQLGYTIYRYSFRNREFEIAC